MFTIFLSPSLSYILHPHHDVSFHRPPLQRKGRPSGVGDQRQVGSSTSASAAASSAAAEAATAAAFAADEMDVDLASTPMNYFSRPHRALQVLSRYKALVVDASYRPVDVVNWQRAICMDLLEKADVLEYYDTTVSSTSEEFYLPAVMKTRWYNNKRRLRVALSRRNILLRDNFCCQYCGKSGKNGNVALTLDHVLPQSRGGRNEWSNLVIACAPCNSKKGDKLLKDLRGWKLKKEPREPSPWELDLVLASIGASDLKQVPEEWSNYLLFGGVGGGGDGNR